MEQDIPRFDWSEIQKAVIIVAIGCLLFGLAVPIIGAVLGAGDTGPTAGNDIFLWAFRAVMWGLIIWRGAVMGQVVGDRIVDDMLVMAAVASIVWLVVKVGVVVVVFEAVGPDGVPNSLIEINDLFAIGAALLISWLGAKANRF